MISRHEAVFSARYSLWLKNHLNIECRVSFIASCEVRIRSAETVAVQTSSMVDFKRRVSAFVGYRSQFSPLSMAIDCKSAVKVKRDLVVYVETVGTRLETIDEFNS